MYYLELKSTWRWNSNILQIPDFATNSTIAISYRHPKKNRPHIVRQVSTPTSNVVSTVFPTRSWRQQQRWILQQLRRKLPQQWASILMRSSSLLAPPTTGYFQPKYTSVSKLKGDVQPVICVVAFLSSDVSSGNHPSFFSIQHFRCWKKKSSSQIFLRFEFDFF